MAVKTIRAERRLSAVHKARFLREARLLGKLGHPAICQVYDLIETPEADFLILEYIEGSTLRELARREPLSLDRRLELAEKIATALAAAHREQIVHRDLKADNVMVTRASEVKVLDFGVARSLTEPGEARPRACRPSMTPTLDSTPERATLAAARPTPRRRPGAAARSPKPAAIPAMSQPRSWGPRSSRPTISRATRPASPARASSSGACRR